MNNLVFLRTKSEDFDQRYFEILHRINCLTEYYGVQQFVDACQDSKHINTELRWHITNLVCYYGHGEVASLVRVLYSDKLRQAS